MTHATLTVLNAEVIKRQGHSKMWVKPSFSLCFLTAFGIHADFQLVPVQEVLRSVDAAGYLKGQTGEKLLVQSTFSCVSLNHVQYILLFPPFHHSVCLANRYKIDSGVMQISRIFVHHVLQCTCTL